MKTLIKFVIGIIFIVSIFWIRFIYKREIILLNEISLNLFQITIKLLLIIFFLFILYLNITKILKYSTRNIIPQNKYIKRLLILVKEYVIDTPGFIYKKITMNKDYDLVCDKFAYELTFYNPKYIIITFLVIPQILIATIFLIDIFYFKILHYFFISLNLLIVILIVRLLRFVIEIFSRRRTFHMEQYLNIEKVDSKGFNFNFKENLPPKQLFTLLPKKNKEIISAQISLLPPELQKKPHLPLIIIEDTLIPLARIWYHYRSISDYITLFDEIYYKYIPFVHIYTSLCFATGWSYYLYITI